MKAQWWFNAEGHQHGRRTITQTSVIEFCYWNEKYYSSSTHQSNIFSSLIAVQLLKPWMITPLSTIREPCRAAIWMWCSAEIWKFQRFLQQNEERCRAKRKSYLWIQALHLTPKVGRWEAAPKRGRDCQVEEYEKSKAICHLVIEIFGTGELYGRII